MYKFASIKKLAPNITIEYLPIDCFEASKNNPEFKEHVDAIFEGNLEHFLNPTQHRQHVALITFCPGS